MKIKIGIVGYGNLGKAVENEILKRPDFELVGVFSRRQNIACKGKLYSNEKILDFKDKIDLLILCGNSQKDMLIQPYSLLPEFNFINSFDTHSLIRHEKKKLNSLARENKKACLISCGWDPGLLSIFRILIKAIFSSEPKSSWGRGVSMGHSEILRRIKGVKYAIQYTIPNIKNGEINHIRQCYLVLDNEYVINEEKGIKPKVKETEIENNKTVKEANLKDIKTFLERKAEKLKAKNKEIKNKKEQIVKNILNTHNYFENETVKIKFISEKQFLKKHTQFYHKGNVWYKDENFEIQTMVKMTDNPAFTAKIMLAYCRAVMSLKQTKKYGCYTVDDIPLNLLMDTQKYI